MEADAGNLTQFWSTKQLRHRYTAFVCFFGVCSIVMWRRSLLFHYGHALQQREPYPFHQPKLVDISPNVSSLCNPKEIRACQRKLPSAILIGVPKCGSAALSHYLNIHPDIVVAVCPYHYDFFRKNFFRGVDFHKQQMACTQKNQIIIEYNSNNFHDKSVPKRIKAMNETIKLIVVVRNPVTRTISSHVQNKVSGLIKQGIAFKDAIMCNNGQLHRSCPSVGSSIYHYSFKHWLDSFTLKQIHIVDGDKLVKNPVEELKKIERFLGLKPYISDKDVVYVESKGFFCIRSRATYNIECEGAAKGRKHPHVDPETLGKMKLFYKPENEIFFRMIGRSFDWQ